MKDFEGLLYKEIKSSKKAFKDIREAGSLKVQQTIN